MEFIKRFFGIDGSYKFEWFDVSSVLVVLNVIFIMLEFPWAPWVGVANCTASIIVAIFSRAHVNSYVTNFALLVMNIYFLH